MTFTTFLIGGGMGLGVQLFSNTVRKLPLLRRPWEHVIAIGIMGWMGHKYPSWEDASLARVNRMREERKLGPLDKNVWGFGVSKAEAE
mmetsp:Transcript_11875/g.35391  ORF Transcript_11875/g.35391 Transcript_11875/m.35391 type:complete len:88 (+) Transcript_11875:204-467(+)